MTEDEAAELLIKATLQAQAAMAVLGIPCIIVSCSSETAAQSIAAQAIAKAAAK